MIIKDESELRNMIEGLELIYSREGLCRLEPRKKSINDEMNLCIYLFINNLGNLSDSHESYLNMKKEKILTVQGKFIKNIQFPINILFECIFEVCTISEKKKEKLEIYQKIENVSKMFTF
jgi:hypothetical protein